MLKNIWNEKYHFFRYLFPPKNTLILYIRVEPYNNYPMRSLLLFLIAMLLVSLAKSQHWTDIHKIVSSDRKPETQFGNSVAISGNYAIVGAWRDDFGLSGEDSVHDAGAVYIFERDNGGSWSQVQKIVASDKAAENFFSYFSSISGNYALVGNLDHDTNGPRIYIFKKNSLDLWDELENIEIPNRVPFDSFGYSGFINNDDGIVGAPTGSEEQLDGGTLHNFGAAYIFSLPNDSASSSTISFYNEIPNNQAFTERKKLWEGSTNSVAKPPMKICADGSKATVIEFVNKTSIPNGNIRFTLESFDQNNPNVDHSGEFSISDYEVLGSKIKVYFSHPQYMDEDGLFRTDKIQVIDIGNDNQVVYEHPLEVYRAPVIAVHGLWGDASSFQKMKEELTQTHPMVPASLFYNHDYRLTNASAFRENRDEIRKAIINVLKNGRRRGFSCGKVTAIGHSMGGVLIRYFPYSFHSWKFRLGHGHKRYHQ